MKYAFIILLFFSVFALRAQENESIYTKKVLEKVSVQTLFSYYAQDGQNAAVTGGEGTEELTNAAPTMVVQIPIGENGILSVDAGISAYTSASSSNVNPFDRSASWGDDNDHDDKYEDHDDKSFGSTQALSYVNGNQGASPWVASSGASRSDVLAHFNPSYAYFSEDRNTIYNASLAFSKEYDYQSIGFGMGISKLYNEKNTELGLNLQVYIDEHDPQYPIELRTGFFDSNIRGEGTYTNAFAAFSQTKRNTYALSLNLAQILTNKMQVSFFIDAVMQEGLLSSPLQRVYFADKENFFIDAFQLADNVERLPFYRYKYPVGARMNFYLSDTFILRSYARYYADSWGVQGLTAEIELPIIFGLNWAVFPSFRHYSQTAADYFYPKEMAKSTDEYYTSDYDLSAFNSQQWGVGIRYKDILGQLSLWKVGLKSIELRYIHYNRSNGLSFDQTALGFNFDID